MVKLYNLREQLGCMCMILTLEHLTDLHFTCTHTAMYLIANMYMQLNHDHGVTLEHSVSCIKLSIEFFYIQSLDVALLVTVSNPSSCYIS